MVDYGISTLRIVSEVFPGQNNGLPLIMINYQEPVCISFTFNYTDKNNT